jgi:inosine-uridine nucleoside N-ribohydrolase
VEFNIQTDPEAAKVVFESGVQLTMVPLEVRARVCGRRCMCSESPSEIND